MYRAPLYRPQEYVEEDEVFYDDPPLPPRLPVPRGGGLGWRVVKYGIILAVWGGLMMGLALIWFAWDLPRPDAALDAARRPSLTLEDSTGRVFATFGDVVGEPMTLHDLPKYMPEAAVAIEDRRFYEHGAIDPIGIARALWTDLLHFRVVQGGSTIAQQVAKNLFLSNTRTFRRKVQELLLTLWLERHFTRDEILEIWLNRVYLGSGAWGVDAAAHIYFGISAKRLNLWQCAVIAGLPRAPSRFNPRVDPQAAAARAREVLTAMVQTGAITQAQADAAGREISFAPRPDSAASYFADWVSDAAQADLDPSVDAVLKTTLDSRIQAVAEQKLREILDRDGVADNVSQGAVVVLDAASGDVRAMVGGRDYRTGPYNRAVLARRQPGSAFKPFVYLAALEKGLRPDDTVSDAPINLGGWSPANFEPKFHGEITLEEALADSVNTAAVRVLLQAGGPKAAAAVAHRLGIADSLPDNVTLALGTGTVGVLEMAGAYAAFFNGGDRVTPTGLRSIDTGGHDSVVPHAAPERVIDPDLAAMMVRMMNAVVTRGSGRAAAVAGRFVAGKTGTTSDYRDAWFVGGTGGRIIAVWLGNDDDTPMKGVTGGSLPAKIFHDIAAAIGP